MTEKSYARIRENAVAEIITTTLDIAQQFHASIAATFVDITDLATKPSVGWTYNGATFSAPPPPAVTWADRRGQALAALAASDLTVMRCFEAGVAVPTAWRNYRAALRAIVSAETGDASAGLPAQPDYPAGT